jgi:hypothetical protein
VRPNRYALALATGVALTPMFLRCMSATSHCA